jgi:acyl-CoA thioesterase FadM
MVLVDVNSRKSASVPDWFKTKYAPYADEGFTVSYKSPQPPTRNNKVFRFEYKMAPSDTDMNGHVNSAVYIHLCIDAATVGCLEGTWFENLHGDLAVYNCTSMQGVYSKESDMNDVVHVLTWEDKQIKSRLNFDIVKGDSKLFLASMTFTLPAIKAAI